MLPITFASHEWRCSLGAACFRGARMFLKVAGHDPIDMLGGASEPMLEQGGDNARVSRAFGAQGVLIGMVFWNCSPDQVRVHVQIKAESDLLLEGVTICQLPLEQLHLGDDLPTMQLQPRGQADKSPLPMPGIFPIEKDVQGSFCAALFNGQQALGMGFLMGQRHISQTNVADSTLSVGEVVMVPVRKGSEWVSDTVLFTAAPTPGQALEHFADEFGFPRRYTTQDVTCWSSWDYYFQSFDENNIFGNMDLIAKRPSLESKVRAIVIDDGWQDWRGDWRTGPNMGGDLSTFVARCHADGVMPGIWTAPFLVEFQATLVRKRPDLICRKADGSPVQAMMWYLLDPTHPDGEKIIRNLYRRLYALGFRYFKLDFLLLITMAERLHRPDLGRIEVMRRTLKMIREEIKDSYMLGCTAPPEAVVGIVDGNRIGFDISIQWRSVVRNALTVAGSYWMHNRLFVSDPDFAVVRGPETSPDPHLPHPVLTDGRFGTLMGEEPQPFGLSIAEARALASVVLLSGGAISLSDCLPKLNEVGLGIIETLLAHANGVAATPLDLTTPPAPTVWLRSGEQPLLALCNWGDAPQEVRASMSHLAGAPGLLNRSLTDIWTGVTIEPGARGGICTCVPAHSVMLLKPSE